MKRTLTLFSMLVVLTFASCTGFQREWDAAIAVPYDGIEGPWEGTWLSSANGHNGKLRCVVTRKADDEYEYHYWASWAGFLSGSFRTVHKALPSADGKSFALSGEKDLGALGGVYRFTGTSTATTMKADYTSAGTDTGVFEMKRP